MVKTTLYLPDELKRAVEDEAARRGVAEAEVIRDVLAQGLPARRPRPRGGLFAGREPIADRVDELLEGKPADLKDSTGKHFVREMVALAREKGGGYVDYLWPRSGVATDPAQPKITYVKLFPAWGWVIGTGVYVDDIDTAFSAAALRFGALVAVVIAPLVIIGLWVYKPTSR